MRKELMQLSQDELVSRLVHVYGILQDISKLDENLPKTVPVSRQQLEAMAGYMNLAITWSKLTLDAHDIPR